jgi:argonaute-like protein implicated in RNA metabolism and viral defense
MCWFKNKRKQEEFVPKDIHFLGEQDGIPERILKEELFKFFTTIPQIKRVYLVRVAYDDPNAFEVALCIKADINKSEDEKSLVSKICEIFTRQFSNKVHMDILFLKEEKEEQLKKVCKPFYG